MVLTEVAIKQAKPKDKAYKIADSGGIIARFFAGAKTTKSLYEPLKRVYEHLPASQY